MGLRRFLLLPLLLAGVAAAQPKKVLYLTHSAGFRHDSLPISQQTLRDLGTRSGKLQIIATEDLSALNNLGEYSAVAFFTSGELDLSDAQKQLLLDFVRGGGGFAGFHSATDTLYTWPEYGELIGARFDGHPWVQRVRIDVEDPAHPATQHLAPSFEILDEIYQFREFSRDRVRVLMTLDTSSVDVRATGVNRVDDDFALAWTRLYGNGRVFYTALGHFDETWKDARFQQMVAQALLWVTGQVDGAGQPQPVVQPSILPNGIGNAATMQPAMTVSAGAYVSIYGSQLTSGATMAADVRTATNRLAGTRVYLNGRAARIGYASPGQINLLAPLDLEARACSGRPCVEVRVDVPRSTAAVSQTELANTTPGIFTVTTDGVSAVLWSTGLGPVRTLGEYQVTAATPVVSVNGVPTSLLFSGLTPGWPGLYQVNVLLPAGVAAPYEFRLSVQ